MRTSLALAVLFLACDRPTSATRTGAPGASAPSMTPQPANSDGVIFVKPTYAGPVRAPLDERLQRRDTSPLPAGVLVRIQGINRGKNPAGNRRTLIMKSGDVFSSGRSKDTSDWKTPFDLPLPSVPTSHLPSDRIEAAKNLLDDPAFADQAPYQANDGVEDGAFVVVTWRSGNATREIIYDAFLPAPAKELLRLLEP